MKASELKDTVIKEIYQGIGNVALLLLNEKGNAKVVRFYAETPFDIGEKLPPKRTKKFALAFIDNNDNDCLYVLVHTDHNELFIQNAEGSKQDTELEADEFYKMIFVKDYVGEPITTMVRTLTSMLSPLFQVAFEKLNEGTLPQVIGVFDGRKLGMFECSRGSDTDETINRLANIVFDSQATSVFHVRTAEHSDNGGKFQISIRNAFGFSVEAEQTYMLNNGQYTTYGKVRPKKLEEDNFFIDQIVTNVRYLSLLHSVPTTRPN